MSRLFLRLAYLIFVVAMALRCDTANPVDPDASGPPMAAIHRVVLVASSPVGGARVSLTGPGVTREATTGTDGPFGFADLPAGLYFGSKRPASEGMPPSSHIYVTTRERLRGN